jgi:hypothetical protein
VSGSSNTKTVRVLAAGADFNVAPALLFILSSFDAMVLLVATCLAVFGTSIELFATCDPESDVKAQILSHYNDTTTGYWNRIQLNTGRPSWNVSDMSCTKEP